MHFRPLLQAVPVSVVGALAVAGAGMAIYMRKRRGQQEAVDAVAARHERRTSRQRSQAAMQQGVGRAPEGAAAPATPDPAATLTGPRDVENQ